MNDRSLAFSAILSATVLWGLSHVITKFVVAEFDPFAVVALRITAGAVLIVAIQKLRGRILGPLLMRWKEILPLAFTGIFVSQFGFILGLSLTRPEHGALIYTLSPIITALLAVIFRGDRLGRWQVVGIAIAFSGAVLLVSGGGVEIRADYILGDLIMLGAVTGWSYYTVFSVTFVKENGTLNTLAAAFVYAAPIAWIFGFVPVLQQDFSNISTVGWVSFSYLVLLATVLTTYLFTTSLKHLNPTTVAVFVYLQPVVTATGAWLLLKQPITVHFLMSASLVMTGLIIFTFFRRKRFITD